MRAAVLDRPSSTNSQPYPLPSGLHVHSMRSCCGSAVKAAFGITCDVLRCLPVPGYHCFVSAECARELGPGLPLCRPKCRLARWFPRNTRGSRMICHNYAGARESNSTTSLALLLASIKPRPRSREVSRLPRIVPTPHRRRVQRIDSLTLTLICQNGRASRI